MFLAGIPVTDDLVLDLARLVDDPNLAERLETAYSRETRVLALDDPPAGLEELRAVLLREFTARARGELA